MNGDLVCTSRSVSVYGRSRPLTPVHDEKDSPINENSSPGNCQQTDGPKQAEEDRRTNTITSTPKEPKADFQRSQSCFRSPNEHTHANAHTHTNPQPVNNNNNNMRASTEHTQTHTMTLNEHTQTHTMTLNEHTQTHTLSPSPLHNNNSSSRVRLKVKGKKSALRNAGGKNSQNRKVTDYYPIRRSSRKSKTELKVEEKKQIDDLITQGIEEGMEVQNIEGKGRGVFATRCFCKGEYVVEYHGDLLLLEAAKHREAEYALNPATGCYMYYFQYQGKTYCVDATRESGRLGRLINHSKNGNLQTKLHAINGCPHLILVASRDLRGGEELLYDYGDRSKDSIAAHPWLKY